MLTKTRASVTAWVPRDLPTGLTAPAPTMLVQKTRMCAVRSGVPVIGIVPAAGFANSVPTGIRTWSPPV